MSAGKPTSTLAKQLEQKLWAHPERKERSPIACPNSASPTPTNNRHTNSPAGLKVAAWQEAPIDHMRAPKEMEVDGKMALASSVPGIDSAMYEILSGKRQPSAA